MAHVEFTEETIHQGEAHTIETTVLDADGNPIDLTEGGAECTFYVGRDWGTDPDITKTLSDGINGTAGGDATISLTAAETAAMNHTHRHPWTLWAKSASGTLGVAARGVLHVQGTVRAGS